MAKVVKIQAQTNGKTLLTLDSGDKKLVSQNHILKTQTKEGTEYVRTEYDVYSNNRKTILTSEDLEKRSKKTKEIDSSIDKDLERAVNVLATDRKDDYIKFFNDFEIDDSEATNNEKRKIILEEWISLK
jgi:hypothetical protein